MGKEKKDSAKKYERRWIVSNPFVDTADFSISVGNEKARPHKIKKLLISYINSNPNSQIMHVQSMKFCDDAVRRFFILMNSVNRMDRLNYNKAKIIMTTTNTISGKRIVKIPISNEISNQLTSIYDICSVTRTDPIMVFEFSYKLKSRNLTILAIFADPYQKIDIDTFKDNVIYIISLDVNPDSNDASKPLNIKIGEGEFIKEATNNILSHLYTFWDIHNVLNTQEIMDAYSEKSIDHIGKMCNNYAKLINNARIKYMDKESVQIMENFCRARILMYNPVYMHYAFDPRYYSWFMNLINNGWMNTHTAHDLVEDPLMSVNPEYDVLLRHEYEMNGLEPFKNNDPVEESFPVDSHYGILPKREEDWENDDNEGEQLVEMLTGEKLDMNEENHTEKLDLNEEICHPFDLEDDEDPMKFQQSSSVTDED